eukprot:CAMPEP_0173456216 /NCGR_PEP_ID=MMETSP1357-20121228/55651_1 /TAXON_ID=77926 /ORGANISM="Hemiselmis rufescens, Strain PCC563" /LENGTH=113 /DNA_ID=CAMNT_0014423409 /DNA_START=1 /DNA_END=339 /DNA_ORIENTATION=+
MTPPLKATKLDMELQRAARSGNVKLLRQLLAKGARLAAQDADGWTPLHAAAAEGRAEAVEAICQHDGCYDVNAATGDGRTPLFFASVDGSLPCVQALLSHGANAHALTREGKD